VISAVVSFFAEAADNGSGLSIVLGAFFAAMSGCIISDLWLDPKMTRPRGIAWFLALSCLSIAGWTIVDQPFG
jgi:hypothetical protein